MIIAPLLGEWLLRPGDGSGEVMVGVEAGLMLELESWNEGRQGSQEERKPAKIITSLPQRIKISGKAFYLCFFPKPNEYY